MSEENTENSPEIEKEEAELNEFHAQFQQAIANIAVAGEPFYKDGEYFMKFGTENEIYEVTFSKKPNNIIQFPQKKKTPPRI